MHTPAALRPVLTSASLCACARGVAGRSSCSLRMRFGLPGALSAGSGRGHSGTVEENVVVGDLACVRANEADVRRVH